MENDSIRSSGSNTLVDVWIEGRMRGICVSREAIEHFLKLPADQAAEMSEDDRCEFVRTNLALIMTAARSRLREAPTADTIVIDKGQIGRRETVRIEDRRKGDRRKAERRTGSRAQGDRPLTDRRSGQRRKGQRRSRKSDPES